MVLRHQPTSRIPFKELLVILLQLGFLLASRLNDFQMLGAKHTRLAVVIRVGFKTDVLALP